MDYFLFYKKTANGAFKNENMTNQEIAEELHKPVARKSKKRKICSSFTDNLWGADVADMQLISKFNKGIRFLLCMIDIDAVIEKYAWVIPLKYKKCFTISNDFQKILDESNRKPNKIWVDNDRKFQQLKDNNMEIYSTHNEEKFVVADTLQ